MIYWFAFLITACFFVLLYFYWEQKEKLQEYYKNLEDLEIENGKLNSKIKAMITFLNSEL